MGLDWRPEIYFRLFYFHIDLPGCAAYRSHPLYRSFHFERYRLQLLVRTSETGHLLSINALIGG